MKNRITALLGIIALASTTALAGDTAKMANNGNGLKDVTFKIEVTTTGNPGDNSIQNAMTAELTKRGALPDNDGIRLTGAVALNSTNAANPRIDLTIASPEVGLVYNEGANYSDIDSTKMKMTGNKNVDLTNYAMVKFANVLERQVAKRGNTGTSATRTGAGGSPKK